MKKRSIRALAVLLASALLCALLPMMASAAENIAPDFTDAKFRARIYVLLDRADTEPIQAADLAQIEELWVGTRGIQSLAGLEHFTGLRILGCYANELTALPALPAGLEELYCANNKLTALPEPLPAGLTHLSVSGNLFTSLPALPTGLKILWCSNNRLTALPKLPATLERLYCENNLLRGIDARGAPLEYLECKNNEMVGVTDIRGFAGKLPLLFDNKAFRFYPQSRGFWAPWNEWVLLALEFVGFGWAWTRLIRLFWA